MNRVANALKGALHCDIVVTDRDILESLRHDKAPTVDAGRPAAAVRARTLDDVVTTVRVANELRAPIVTRGAATGLSGGANAIEGCIVLSVASMNDIIGIDVTARTATVQPGVINGDLATAVANHGLWYAPDPASRAISTIGGNIATNAGGSCCAKYGVTGDHVARIKAVLGDGSLIHTGALTRKNVAGYDLTRLLVGSEGTLAIVVEATVRLRPAPRIAETIVATFNSMTDAGNALAAIDGAADPLLLELMDRTTIGAVEEMTKMGLDTSAGALLVAQTDSSPDLDEAGRIESACEQANATFVARTTDADEAEVFLHARRSALPALERLGTVLLDDVAVPKHELVALIIEVEAIATRYDVVVGTFGHAGDGNLHPTIVFNPTDPGSTAAAQAAFSDILAAAAVRGGTITGEHGVGTLKTPFLDVSVGTNERALMARIKSAFDPYGILNPGKAI